MVETTLTYDALGITSSMIYEQMGYGSSLPDANVCSEIDALLRQIRKILRPRFAFFIADGTLCEDNMTLKISRTLEATNVTPHFEACETFNVGRIITRQLRGASQYGVFVCTAGMSYQLLQDRLMQEGDMVRVFVADAVGSVIAECVADRMQESMAKYVADLGYSHTNRFSPGYCGWHVSEQQRLFSLFPQPSPCGVSLTDSSLMLPIKSVSGIIGIGKNVRYLNYTCGLCNYSKCYKRKQRSELKDK